MEFEVPSTPAGVEDAMARVGAALDALPLSSMDRGQCTVGLQEALNNALLHGNRHRPGTRIRVAVEPGDRCIEFRVADEGRGFDARRHLAYAERLAQMRDGMRGRPGGVEPRGLGIAIMHRTFAEVEFSRGGSEVRLVYRYDPRADPDRDVRRFDVRCSVQGPTFPGRIEIRPGPPGEFHWLLIVHRPPVPTRIAGACPGEPGLEAALGAIRADPRIAKMRLEIL